MPEPSTSSSISAAAHAYQMAMSAQQAVSSLSSVNPEAVEQESTKDTIMNEVASEIPGVGLNGSL